MEQVRDFYSFFRESVDWAYLLEALGAITGIIGALIMAVHPAWEVAAWSFWLVSSASLLIFARLSNLKWLLFLQSVFLAINILGLSRSTGLIMS